MSFLALGLRPIKLSFCPYFFFSQPGQRVKDRCTWGITSEIRRVCSVLRRKHSISSHNLISLSHLNWFSCHLVEDHNDHHPATASTSNNNNNNNNNNNDCHHHRHHHHHRSPDVCCKSRAQHQGKVAGSWSCSTSMSWKHSPDAVAECLTLPTAVPCRLGISNIRRTGRQKMGKMGLGCGSLGVLRDLGWLVGWLGWFVGSKLFGEVE